MIVLQVGQCGVQVGQALFSRLKDEIPKEAGFPVYPLSLFQQLVVDTERKAYRRRHRHDGQSPFNNDTHFIDLGTNGRGNNWMHGFLDTDGIPDIMEQYRRMVEASYRYDGCMLMHSLAGGTGSGLGSRLSFELRDAYPKNFILSTSVLPFESGETCIQDYNTMLTLASLQHTVDSVSIVTNDSVMRNVGRLIGVDGGYTTSSAGMSSCVSVEQLNAWVSEALAGILLPISPVRASGSTTSAARSSNVYPDIELSDRISPFRGWDLVSRVTPIPSTKICMYATSCPSSTISSMASRPTSARENGGLKRSAMAKMGANKTMEWSSWDDVVNDMCRSMPPFEQGSKRKCIGVRWNVRGVQGADFWCKWPSLRSKWEQRLGGSMPDLTTDIQTSYLYGLDANSSFRSSTMIYNSTDIVPIINRISAHAHEMYKHNAYVHWYEKYAGKDTHAMMSDAFESVCGVRDAYVEL